MSFNILTIFTIFPEMLFLDIMAGAFFQETPSLPRVRLKAVGFITASAVQVVNVFLFHHMFWLKVFFAFLIDYLYILGFYQAKASDSLGCITFCYSVMTGIDFIGRLLRSIPEASHNI